MGVMSTGSLAPQASRLTILGQAALVGDNPVDISSIIIKRRLLCKAAILCRR